MMFKSDNNLQRVRKKIESPSIDALTNKRDSQVILKVSLFVLLICFCSLFLPWTQNIKASGKVTTLRPEQRPQEVNAIISGQIEKWYVREGDFLKKGDTILKLSETKVDYLDPNLISRTDDQIKAKESSAQSYRQKITAIDAQMLALLQARELKMEQLKNKIRQAEVYVQSDSMAMVAAKNQFKIATDQLKRQKELYDSGLKSLTELEQRNQALQDANAKMIISENKLNNARNDLMNSKLEFNSVMRDYDEKIAKAESDKYSTISMEFTTESEISKMINQRSSYALRSGFYIITAPQDGQVISTRKGGIGESVKEGDPIAAIVPVDYDLAVEMFVKPNDIPLLSIGQRVMFQFDGWPTIFFSGWPELTYGTFAGKVVAIENNISDNGSYRILVSQIKGEKPWPKALRAGSGAKGIALLKTVPVWYEIWRNLNGFPPDYYIPAAKEKSADKKSKS